MTKLSFVIPCYRSENTIEQVVSSILDSVKKLAIYDYEIILINDYSPDNVYQVIQRLCSKNIKIKGIDLSRNFGQHNAIMAGFSKVTGDIIIDVDDDGQIPIDQIDQFISKINQGYDIVIGNYTEGNSDFFRKIGTKINDLMMQSFISKPKDIHFTSFVVMNRFVIDEIIRYENPYPYLAGLMLRSSSRITNIPVTRNNRTDGKSGYNISKLISLWVNGLTSFSIKPLRAATVLGVIIAFVGFLFAIIIVINKIISPEIQAGYSSLMAGLLIIGGSIMLMLGVVGEYIGRIYISLNNAPQYVIRDKINLEDSENDE